MMRVLCWHDSWLTMCVKSHVNKGLAVMSTKDLHWQRVLCWHDSWHTPRESRDMSTKDSLSMRVLCWHDSWLTMSLHYHDTQCHYTDSSPNTDVYIYVYICHYICIYMSLHWLISILIYMSLHYHVTTLPIMGSASRSLTHDTHRTTPVLLSMSHITHANESCHYITHTNESCHNITHANESCHYITHANESCH